MITLQDNHKFRQRTVRQISHLTDMGSTHNTVTECSSTARTDSARVLGTHTDKWRPDMSDILVTYQYLTPFQMALSHKEVNRVSTTDI